MPVTEVINPSNNMYPEATESPRTSNFSATPTKASPEKVKLSAPSGLDDLCPTTSASPSPPPSNIDNDFFNGTLESEDMEVTEHEPKKEVKEEHVHEETNEETTEEKPVFTDDAKLYHCPMMSCETKENFRGIEKHLEIDHPDLFVLYKRDLQAKYNHSVVKCPICKFHFATAAAYEQHLPEQCAIFAKKQINPALISYFKTQCSDELREVVEEMEAKSEFTFSCPIISCSEGFNSLGLLCWHMETDHPKKNAHFRRNIPCVQFVGPRCDDCGFTFPKPAEWSHPCEKFKQISFENEEEKEEAARDLNGDEATPHSLGNHLGVKEEPDQAIRCDDCGENFFSEEDVYCHKWRDHCESNPALTVGKLLDATSVESSVELLSDNLASASSSFTPASTDIHSRFSLAGVQEEWARGPPAKNSHSNRGDLSYQCPIKTCGKAFSKLGGIFKHLVPAHGYSGVLFRMQHKVPGLMMICETCNWNYADKNAIYKHRHLNTCVSNIRITNEQKEAYENDPNKRPLDEIMAEIDFNVLEAVTGENYRPPPGTRKRITPSNLMTLPADADTTQYIHDNIAANRSPSPSAMDLDNTTPTAADSSTNSFSQLGVDFDKLTPETAATLLQLITHSLSTGAQLPSINNISPEKSSPDTVTGDPSNINICPAWGCKRKFTAFTHGGKSNISSLWIHMQNAHRNAFVVFRRMRRRGFDRFCDKCQFWLKGAEWYNHKNNRRYQTEGARPEGTYCDVYQKLAEGLEQHANPLLLVDIKMCIEKYDCLVDDAEDLIAQQMSMEDPTMKITEITDPDEFADVDQSPVHTAFGSRNSSPMPMQVSITGSNNSQTNMVCPIKSCKKQVVKPETQSHACWKNLFTHIKANHKNAYVLFRRLERENTKKRCSECLFWFVNYRDYGAHNQRTGTNRDGGPRISYCQQYQRMALHDCKVKSIHELPSYEQLDFRVLEEVYKCKIPFDMDEGSPQPASAVDSPVTVPELSIVEEPEDIVGTEPVLPFGQDLIDTEVNPSHKPHDGQYLCAVRNCQQQIKTMKGVLGHMRIKHKREYIIFRRTKMALSHRKCEKCLFWFSSAKTYHQHKSQLPHQLPGENKGSECDAYIRIAKTFTPYELADHSNFVTALFEYYVNSTYQDRPHSRRKTNESYLEKITAALSTSFPSSSANGLSGLSGLSLLEGFGNGLPLNGTSSPTVPKYNGEKTPDPDTIIECPINDCPIQVKFSSLDTHISRKHPESFYHFKISDFEAFTFRCPECKFGYFSEEYFKRDHIDCATNSEEKHRENIAPGDFEKDNQGNFSRHLKIIDCPVNIKLNTGEKKSPLQPLRGKSQDVFNLSFKQDELERYDSISDVKAHCPDKNCIYVAPLRTLTTHASEKHPKLNVQFRTQKSVYFDQRCDACGFFFYSRSAIYNHKSTKKCEYYASERIKYEKWLEEVGPQGSLTLQDQIRDTIKFNHGNKRKSAVDYAGDLKRSKFDLDTELDSSVADSQSALAPRDCPYCLSKCLAGTFTGLCAHIRGSHPDRYIEYRTTRWPTTTHICKRCKFGTELPVEVWRRQHTSKVCNDNIASFKKYDTSRLTIEEPTRGDENPCPICNQETLGVKGLVTHMRFSHPDLYLKWRTVPNAVMGFQCAICGFCYSTDNELHNHQRKEGACKRNLDQLTYGLESTSSKNNTPSSASMNPSMTPIQIPKLPEMTITPLLDTSLGSSSSSPEKSSQQSAEETSEEMLVSPKSGKSRTPAEYHCKICQNGVSFPTFGLLNVHMKNDHEKEYIHFRITKTDQISIRCSICHFCFPAQNHYERHLNKKSCVKNKRLYDKYVESLEDDGDESDW